ncbi:MAG: hypothetical protein ACREAO_02540 [Nitrososphaera sp.]
MLISYFQAETPMHSVYSLPSNLEKLNRKQIELRMIRTKKRIEDLEIDISVLNDIIFSLVAKQDQLMLKMPLVIYPPQRQKLDVEYEQLSEQKNEKDKINQNLKHELATLNYNLEELSIELDTIQDAVELSDD